MTTLHCNHNWTQFNSHQNQCFEDDQEQEQDTLSFCDLPTNNHQINTHSNNEDNINDQQDFEFDSIHGGATAFRSPENMCNADEVFFQGQILPLHEKYDPRTIRSNGYGYGYSNKPKKIRNQFHSHPSPSPQIRTRSFRTYSQSKPRTTSLWGFLQVGLAKQQEIGLSDLKNRSKRFGSYNSNSSSNSSSANSTKDQNKTKEKKKQRLFLGGCNCSADAIECTIKETGPKKATRKGEKMLHVRDLLVTDGRTMTGGGRHVAARRHRTFEWLKQLN
ncbi:hypothetical protein QVD17_24915 [Tagetes erecta]|uniref:Uncharacterized protein n=1 Tax=Tagetes erecta TaxID=13708 RepID=A0AAD8NV89_TARER|nr:hypothetical protein QVD17_24915 [Tagetes erecta]